MASKQRSGYPITEIIPNTLWLGAESDALDKNLLLKLGITHVVTVELALSPPFPEVVCQKPTLVGFTDCCYKVV